MVSVVWPGPETRYGTEPPVFSPRTLADAYRLLEAVPPPRPLAGGTDVLVEIAVGQRDRAAALGGFLDLSHLPGLRGIRRERDGLLIGALTTYTELRRSEVARELAPALGEAAATIGAGPIQHRGTIGGNIANASPAGDLLPVLIALDAEIDLGGPRWERGVRAGAFFTGYRQTALAPGELILRVWIPIVAGREVRFRKVGTRRAQAISKVTLALAWRPGDGGPATGAGGRWHDVRVALGSVAPTPIRAQATEAVLEGASPTADVAALAAETLAAELHPIDDVRSTAEYRRTVAARILHRMLRDAGGW